MSKIKKMFRDVGNPIMIYSDPDSGVFSGPLQELSKNSEVERIISRLHAHVAGRTIRTRKGLLKVAVDSEKSVDQVRTRVLPEVLHTYNY